MSIRVRERAKASGLPKPYKSDRITLPGKRKRRVLNILGTRHPADEGPLVARTSPKNPLDI